MAKTFTHEPDARRYVLRIDDAVVAVVAEAVRVRGASREHPEHLHARAETESQFRNHR